MSPRLLSMYSKRMYSDGVVFLRHHEGGVLLRRFPPLHTHLWEPCDPPIDEDGTLPVTDEAIRRTYLVSGWVEVYRSEEAPSLFDRFMNLIANETLSKGIGGLRVGYFQLVYHGNEKWLVEDSRTTRRLFRSGRWELLRVMTPGDHHFTFEEALAELEKVFSR